MKAKAKKTQKRMVPKESAPVTVTPDLMDEKQAANYITMSVAYLRAGRSRGVTGGTTPHPPYLKLGRAIRYQRTDLDAWLQNCRHTSTVHSHKAPVQAAG